MDNNYIRLYGIIRTGSTIHIAGHLIFFTSVFLKSLSHLFIVLLSVPLNAAMALSKEHKFRSMCFNICIIMYYMVFFIDIKHSLNVKIILYPMNEGQYTHKHTQSFLAQFSLNASILLDLIYL
jgi:hypothetical protein